MLELGVYFDGMSKTQLRDVHAKAYGKKGLLNNSLIQTEVIAYFNDKIRIADIFNKMEPWQRRCLNLVYHSGPRGLTYNELRLTVNVAKNRELKLFLLSMCREYLLWRTQNSSNPVYHGFKNFAGCFDLSAEESVDLTQPSFSYGNLIDWHVCQVLSYAKKGELKVNANGSLNRRCYQQCVDGFLTVARLSPKAAESELSLIFNFLIQNQWLELENNTLYPSEKAMNFLKKNGFRLHQDILVWWVKDRFHGDTNHCAGLLKALSQGMNITDASFLFWVMDPSYRILERNKALAWEYLPRPLREMWLLGLVDFQIQKDKSSSKITGVVISQPGKDWAISSIMPLPEPSVSALPNFDLIASVGTSPRVLFVLGCLAEVKNDEAYLSFSLNKECYLRGLKCGLPESEIELFRTWIKPPVNVASTLEEWNASFYGARVRTVRLLKLDDKNTMEELSKFPQFMDCAEEYIPGYGFILQAERESRAFEILENFGYCPFVDGNSENRLPAPADEWKKDFSINWPETASPDYELKAEVDDASLQMTMNATKYGSMYHKLDTFDLVKVLRYAKMAGTLLSAQVKDPAKRQEKMKEMTFFVHSLHLAKSPFNVDIQEAGTEEVKPLPLAFIQEVKVLHKKTL